MPLSNYDRDDLAGNYPGLFPAPAQHTERSVYSRDLLAISKALAIIGGGLFFLEMVAQQPLWAVAVVIGAMLAALCAPLVRRVRRVQ